MLRAQKAGPRASPSQKGRNTKLHLAVDASGKPLRVLPTASNVNDCSVAIPLLEGLPQQTGHVLADRGYDTQHILAYCQNRGLVPVIPPRSNRKEQRSYDRTLYRLRHCVENVFLRLKRWHSIGTRYVKWFSSLLAFVHLACAIEWRPKT